MKTLIVTKDINGRRAEVTAKRTYETLFGKWVAEVDGTEIRSACTELCRGIKNCTCDDLHVDADQDDDGKEYIIEKS